MNRLFVRLFAAALLAVAALSSAFATPVTYTATLTDQSGVAVPGATLTSIKIVPLAGGAATTLTTGLTVGSSAPTTITTGSSSVAVLDAGDGDYGFNYDAEVSGEALVKLTFSKVGVVFSGRSNIISVTCSRDSSRILSGISSTGTTTPLGGSVASVTGNVTVGGFAGGVVPPDSTGISTLLGRIPQTILFSGGGFVKAFSVLDLTQTLDTSNTADTVGGALIGARAQAFGKWVITGTAGQAGSTLKLYAADGTTLLRTLSLATSGTRQ